jgi:hypothetical protein
MDGEKDKDEEKEKDIPACGGPAGSQPGPETQFPKGIEGTRGHKDSARRAREHYLKQRGLEGEPDPAEQKNEEKEDGNTD